MARCIRALVVVAVTLTALAIVGSASAQKYIVVLKTGQSQPGIKAINIAGGKIVGVNKLGIATVTSSKPSFAQKLRVSGAVAGVAREALGQVHGLDPERIVCGNGSDDLLHLLAQ